MKAAILDLRIEFVMPIPFGSKKLEVEVEGPPTYFSGYHPGGMCLYLSLGFLDESGSCRQCMPAPFSQVLFGKVWAIFCWEECFSVVVEIMYVSGMVEVCLMLAPVVDFFLISRKQGLPCWYTIGHCCVRSRLVTNKQTNIPSSLFSSLSVIKRKFPKFTGTSFSSWVAGIKNWVITDFSCFQVNWLNLG